MAEGAAAPLPKAVGAPVAAGAAVDHPCSWEEGPLGAPLRAQQGVPGKVNLQGATQAVQDISLVKMRHNGQRRRN